MCSILWRRCPIRRIFPWVATAKTRIAVTARCCGSCSMSAALNSFDAPSLLTFKMRGIVTKNRRLTEYMTYSIRYSSPDSATKKPTDRCEWSPRLPRESRHSSSGAGCTRTTIRMKHSLATSLGSGSILRRYEVGSGPGQILAAVGDRLDVLVRQKGSRADFNVTFRVCRSFRT